MYKDLIKNNIYIYIVKKQSSQEPYSATCIYFLSKKKLITKLILFIHNLPSSNNEIKYRGIFLW